MIERKRATILIALIMPLSMMMGGAAVAQSQSGQSQPADDAKEQPSSHSSQGEISDQQAADEAGQNQASQGGGDAAASEGTAEQAGMIIEKQQSSQMLASSIVGMTVQNGTGEKAQQIGDIADLILDENHQVVGVLIGVGGFLGIGEKYVGVPWSVVQVDPKAGTTVVEVSRKQLEQAPAYATLSEQKEQQQRQQMKQKMQQQRQQQSQNLGATQ